MNPEREIEKKRFRELEIALEEEHNLTEATKTLLQANIKELDSVYIALNEKLRALRLRDERIKGFEAELFRANKLSSLGELASSIAHEIKNPLISIQGFAKRIGKTTDLEKIRQYAQIIDKDSGRLSQVLAKLLNFSRMEEPHKETVDLREIVDDTALFMEHHLTRFKNVGLTVERGKRKSLVFVDRIHIQQVLINIINNAAQAMPDGGTVRIKSGTRKDRGYIAVCDEGEGMDDEILGKLFEPFFTTKPKGVGTGLGLSLSKKLIEANEGTIEVETKKGVGTTFRILLPLTQG
jgi:signal transduction histidine kinase